VSENGSNKRVANSLVALSSAAVLAVFAAGYTRTRAAADRFAVQSDARRPVMPMPAAAPPQTAPASTTPKEAAGSSPIRSRPAATGSARLKIEEPRRFAKTIDSTPRATPPSTPIPAPPAPAAEPAPAVAPPEPVLPRYKDGTYLGWGTSRHGDIQAEVVIEDGRIKAATIAQCLTRYSCNVIANLPPQVAQRQSPETDYVSGATQSADAFYYAVVQALSKAK
jgi:uncharacterized protein with FMN-binding domain